MPDQTFSSIVFITLNVRRLNGRTMFDQTSENFREAAKHAVKHVRQTRCWTKMFDRLAGT